MSEKKPILVPHPIDTLFVTEGVFLALKYAFENPKTVFGENHTDTLPSYPYREMASAYFYLFARVMPSENSEVATST